MLSGQKSHYLLLVVNEVNPMIVHPLSVIYLFYDVMSRLILFKSWCYLTSLNQPKYGHTKKTNVRVTCTWYWFNSLTKEIKLNLRHLKCIIMQNHNSETKQKHKRQNFCRCVSTHWKSAGQTCVCATGNTTSLLCPLMYCHSSYK